MIIDFTKMSIKTSLRGAETIVDMSAVVAEAVYQYAVDFATHKLAHRIDESTGEIELNEKEAQAIKCAISGFKFYAQIPILKALGEVIND